MIHKTRKLYVVCVKDCIVKNENKNLVELERSQSDIFSSKEQCLLHMSFSLRGMKCGMSGNGI